MAQKTITQRIAFEGGTEMEVQLKAIGDAGTTAFTRLKTAADNASGIGARLTPIIEGLRQRLNAVSDAADNFGKKFSNLESSARTVETRFAAVTAAVAGVVIGFAALTIKAASAADSISRGAAAAQLSVERYQELKDAFTVATGNGDEFDTLVKRLNASFGKSVDQARQMTKSQNDLNKEFLKGKLSAEDYSEKFLKINEDAQETVDVFTRLGVTAASSGGDTERALLSTLRAVQALPQGIERAHVEMQIFGRSGVNIEAMVTKLDELEGKTEKIIPPLEKLEIEVGVKLRQAFTTLQLVAEKTEQKMALVFAPDMINLIEAITAAINANREGLIGLALNIEEAIKPVIEDVVKLLKGEEINPDGLVAKVVSAINDIAAAVKIMFNTFKLVFNGIASVLDPIANLINKIFGTELNGRVLAIIAVVGLLSGAFVAVGSAISALIATAEVLGAALVLLFGPEAAIIIAVFALGFALTKLAVEIFPAIQTAFNAFADAVDSGMKTVLDIWDSFIAKIAQAIAAVKSFFGLAGSDSTDAGAPGFAGGGHVRGPGSPTSDSILARLSTGEHVTRAAAVSYYGPRFMDAINQMRIPRSILDGLAGFANGGLVRAMSSFGPVPGFAAGGLVSPEHIGGQGGGHPVTFILDGEKFEGMTAEDRTFNKLQRFAVRRNLQSAGRKPLWVT